MPVASRLVSALVFFSFSWPADALCVSLAVHLCTGLFCLRCVSVYVTRILSVRECRGRCSAAGWVLIAADGFFFSPLGRFFFSYHRRTREIAWVRAGRVARPALARRLSMRARWGAAEDLARDSAARATGRAGPQIGLSCHRGGCSRSRRGGGLPLVCTSGSFGRHRG